MVRNPDLSIGDMFATMGEEIRRTAYEPNINAYKPHKKQVKFHDAVNKRIRLYIGGNRSGKSTAGIVEDIWWCTKRHPNRTFGPRPVVGRLVTTDYTNGVQKVIIPMLQQWVPKSELRGGSWSSAYDVGFRVLHFDNGSSLELMSYDQDLDKFAGTSRDFIHYDEEPPKDIFTECQMRLIDRKGSSWITMTPVEGMTWVYDDIYEIAAAGEHPRIAVVEVGIEENPYLDQDEVNAVMDGLDKDEKEARASGRFVQMGGLVYKAFSRDLHVIPAVDPKEFHGVGFKIYQSLDHGFNNPTSTHWHAVNTQNKVVTFDEHYESERIISYHAAVIHSRDKAHGRLPDIRVCDPALAQRNGVTGTSIQTEYAILGIGFALGNNDVLTGVAKVNQYLALDEEGIPYWRITENCHNLIREIMRLRWQTYATKKQASQNNPSDKIHKKDDHACDDCRYFFTLMPNLAPASPVGLKQQIPEIGGNSAVTPGFRIDPNTTPEALARNRTQWTRVDLGD